MMTGNPRVKWLNLSKDRQGLAPYMFNLIMITKQTYFPTSTLYLTLLFCIDLIKNSFFLKYSFIDFLWSF